MRELTCSSHPGCRCAHPGYRSPDARHRPVFCPAPGLAGRPVPFSPEGRAERQGVHRARGAMCREAHGNRVPKHTAEHSHGSSNTPAFRTRMDFAACCMSQGLSLAPTRPVRASCRPDMHLDRPPVLPASVPRAAARISDPASVSRVRHRSGHPHPAPRFEDDRHAPLIGDGMADKYSWARGKVKRSEEQSPRNLFSENQK